MELIGRISVGNGHAADYAFDIIVMFNKGYRRVVIKGKGDRISKAVVVTNLVRDRMGSAVRIADIRIGSEDRKGRLVSFIEIELERTV